MWEGGEGTWVPVSFHVYFSTSNSATTCLIISLAVTISDVKVSFIYMKNETMETLGNPKSLGLTVSFNKITRPTLAVGCYGVC